MFHALIAIGRDAWLKRPDCPARGLLTYMRERGALRPVQIDALATYLFLKLACDNAPLWRIFMGGLWHPRANSFVFREELERDEACKPAIRLIEAARVPKAQETREANFKTLFYDVAYPDYLFSLPMGAGKTYLMAAMIYLNLYFAEQNPADPTFAHNFLILAPSGTKSSIVPSLRKIRDFDPTWVLPPEDAKRLQRALSFEVLDQGASAARSNRTRNPNAQKIMAHAPLDRSFGLVAVVNAEKVILDRLDKDADSPLLSKDEMARVRVANELRDCLGKLNHLALLVDEAHHVPTARKASGEEESERRLRTVIHGWAAKGNVTEVLGFSGTPYLDKADRFTLNQAPKPIHYHDDPYPYERKSFTYAGMTNVVHHFPLVDGVGVFLKRPEVRTCAGHFTAEAIVEEGFRAFMARHRDTVWPDGSCAKLAIYAGTIERAEEEVAPLVRRLLAEYGLGEETLLIHHQGNKAHPAHAGSTTAFERLDRPDSPIRVIVLVQIGKEGWDCRSLAGVILSQEGDCNRKMVLQTTCRCLREVADANRETAIITLNAANSSLLSEQLRVQQHTTLKDFQAGARPPTVPLHDRRRALGLEGVSLPFYQLRVDYSEVIETPADPVAALAAIDPEEDRFRLRRTIRKGDFKNVTESSVEVVEPTPEHASFWLWLCAIVKEGLDTLPMAELKPHRACLQALFQRVTRPDGADGRVYRTNLDQPEIRAAVRRAFAPHHALRASETRTLEQALLVTGLPACVPNDAYTVPDEAARKAILDHDNAADDPAHNEETRRLIEMLRARGNAAAALALEQETGDRGLRESDRTYHLLPYHMDSSLERRFFEAVRGHYLLEKYGLTLLYNGDRAHTDFKIRCYVRRGEAWRFVGEYTPDFLFLQKQGDRIVRALIVETKGQLFAQDEGFQLRRAFMEQTFVKEQGDAAPRYAYRVYDQAADIASLDDFIERVCNDCFGKEL